MFEDNGDLPEIVQGVPFAHVSHSDATDFQDQVKTLLFYHKVVKAEIIGAQQGLLTLDNGVQLYVEGNEGCGGCTAGWFYLDALNGCDNIITNVECVSNSDSDSWTYHIYVYAEDKKINLVEFSGYDNGYYGTGYNLYVRIADSKK